MTTKSQEIEQARKELELLKERERSLEAKLGLLSKNEEYQYANNKTSLLDEPLPVNNLLSHEDLFQSILMNGDLKESSVDDLSEIEEIEPIEEATDMSKNRKNIVEDLVYDDEDENVEEQKIHEEISEDDKLEDFQFSITNNSQLNFSQSEEELDSEEEEDLEEKAPIDHRNDIFQDIYDGINREKALKIERGLYVESDRSGDETESNDETQIEDSRDRIVREIEEEKLRELELQSKYRGRGIILNRTFEEPEKTQLKDNIETRQLISIEINDLQQREEELRRQWSKQNSTKKRNDEENIFFRMQSEPQQYLENGNSDESKTFQELIKLENLLYYHEAVEEEEREERKKVNPRGKIIQEIEELQFREQELRERTQGIQQKQMELHKKQQEQMENEKKGQQKQKMNLEEQVSTKIMQEILELQRREEDLERQYAKIQQRKIQMSNILNGISSLYLNDSEVRSLDSRRISLKDHKDLKTKTDSQRNVKTNESPNKNTNQPRTSYAQASSNGNKRPSKEDIKNYPKIQRSSHLKLINNENRKKKIILDNSSDLSNGLVSHDAKNEDNIMQYNEKPRHHNLSILPLATKWENKAEEEQHKQLAIQREVQNKRENKIKIKQKKAEQERQMQEQQRLADIERQRTIQERYLLKMKQQGLNDLWAAKKPLVTLEYNEDKNDLHLLDNSFKPIKENKTQYVSTPITLTKTIMKWERRIKRNSMKN